MLDASVAFILVLVLAQLCLLWLHLFVDSTVSLRSMSDRQLELISVSDRLINNPKCLAKKDSHADRVLPQTIDSTKKCKIDGISYEVVDSWQDRGTLVVRRLVFIDEEGGEPRVLEVW